MTNQTTFQNFLTANNLCTVLVNHYQQSGNDYDTYSWHYELWNDNDIYDMPQNNRVCNLDKDAKDLGVESLLMEKKRFHIWCTSDDHTIRININ
jgi:hypothetical protein